MGDDSRTAGENVPSVTDDFTAAAPGMWDGLKHMGSQFKKLMDENPTATKWISFGLALLAGVSWGGSLVHGILASIAPRLENNGLISGLVTCLVWVAAFIGASKLSQALTNSGSETRANERQAAGEQARQNLAAFQAAGGNTSGRALSNDTGTNPTLFAKNGYRINPADQYQAAFTNASMPPQRTAYRPPQSGRVFAEDDPNFSARYPFQPGFQPNT